MICPNREKMCVAERWLSSSHLSLILKSKSCVVAEPPPPPPRGWKVIKQLSNYFLNKKLYPHYHPLLHGQWTAWQHKYEAGTSWWSEFFHCKIDVCPDLFPDIHRGIHWARINAKVVFYSMFWCSLPKRCPFENHLLHFCDKTSYF